MITKKIQCQVLLQVTSAKTLFKKASRSPGFTVLAVLITDRQGYTCSWKMRPHPPSPSKTFRSVASTCVGTLDRSWLAEVFLLSKCLVFCGQMSACSTEASTWHISWAWLEMPSLTARLSSPGSLCYQRSKASAQLRALAALTHSWLQETL